jgi:hypothetical protein
MIHSVSFCNHSWSMTDSSKVVTAFASMNVGIRSSSLPSQNNSTLLLHTSLSVPWDRRLDRLRIEWRIACTVTTMNMTLGSFHVATMCGCSSALPLTAKFHHIDFWDHPPIGSPMLPRYVWHLATLRRSHPGSGSLLVHLSGAKNTLQNVLHVCMVANTIQNGIALRKWLRFCCCRFVCHQWDRTHPFQQLFRMGKRCSVGVLHWTGDSTRTVQHCSATL